MPEPKMVDTRDTRWQEDYPSYRVQVWHFRGNDPDEAPSLEEYQFDDVDVDRVLEWASSQEAPGMQIVVYARIIMDYEPGLIRLRGSDPSAPETPSRG
ncbi:hypothetical protein [Arthrobacter sp. H14]|uniref:hypothetical protein n=1 Tax=Arthrobacter sp. H14 TaxID=1312959 RepID=UPI0004B19741|nr:hypothetical protein [Arthrobacter sp. H14]